MGNEDFIQNYLSEVMKVAQAISLADIDRAIEFFLKLGEMGTRSSPAVTGAQGGIRQDYGHKIPLRQ